VGDQSGLVALLEPLLAVAPPSQVTARPMPFLDAARHFDDGGAPPYHKAKSDYALAPLSQEAIATLLAGLVASPSADDLLQFQPYGGAIDRVPTSATAFPHRAGTLFSMQYLAYWFDPAAAPPSQRWIADFYAAMRPYVSGYAYSNNCDVDILDWQRAYYGANFERLVEVKTKYDPRDVFHFAQSIPPSA
jgi:hypothetical protein